MLRKLEIALAGAFVFIMTFAGVGMAANAVTPDDNSIDAAHAVYAALAGGHYAYAASIALVLAVAVARKYFGKTQPWMHTDGGAAALVLLGSFGTALTASLAGGGDLTIPLAENAAMVAFTAAGGYAALKKLVIVPLAPHLPHWMQAPVLWLFNTPTPSTPTPATNPPANLSASA